MWFDDSDFLLELGWWVRQRLAQNHTQRSQMHAYGHHHDDYDHDDLHGHDPAIYDYDDYDHIGVCGS